LTWWETDVGVTASSAAAALKLPQRAAASNVRKAEGEGIQVGMTPEWMSVIHLSLRIRRLSRQRRPVRFSGDTGWLTGQPALPADRRPVLEQETLS
jgi:hypothetical protein